MHDRDDRLIAETIDSPIGALVVAQDATGALRMVEFADRPARIARWTRRPSGGGGRNVAPGALSAGIKEAFAGYFRGDLGALRDLSVRLDGTIFQNAVWTALCQIAPGETLAYSAFAERLGRPQAARAVGHANGANPLSIVVPCHRLVGADGSLTAYGGGIERKRWLIDHEAQHATTTCRSAGNRR